MAGTAVPFGRRRLYDAVVSEAGSIGREKPARTTVLGATLVALAEGTRRVMSGGELGSSSTMSLSGVSGNAPMSNRMFVVACRIRRSGSPSLSALRARPQFQWLVPVLTISAPLERWCLTMCVVAEPGA